MNVTWKLREVYNQSRDERLLPIIDEMSRSDEHAMRSQMERLLLHICKWEIQPNLRSRSWAASIVDAQLQIEDWLEDEPSLKNKIPLLWDKAMKTILRVVPVETGINPPEGWTKDFNLAMAFKPEFL